MKEKIDWILDGNFLHQQNLKWIFSNVTLQEQTSFGKIPQLKDRHFLPHQHGTIISTTDIIEQEDMELILHFAEYSPFGFNTFESYQMQIERYLVSRIYDFNIDEIAPLAVANALSLRVDSE